MASLLTDPASEFARLATTLRSTSGNGADALSILSTFFGIKTESPQFAELLGVVSGRAQSLIEFVHSVEDEYMDDSLRKAVSDAVLTLSQVVNPSNLPQPWDTIRKNNLSEAHIQTLKLFSRTARHHRPLRIITDEERSAFISCINEALEEIETAELPLWSKPPLRDGLRRLLLIIKRLDAFGHEAAIGHLLYLHAHSQAISVATEKESPRLKSRLEKLGAVFIFATAILSAPDTTVTAFDHYRGWAVNLLTATVPLLAPPQKLLEGPDKDRAVPV